MRYRTKTIDGKFPYDEYVCTVPVREWAYNDADVLTLGPWHECGSELIVVWSFACALDEEPLTAEDVPKSAINSSWEIKCIGGHVIAVDADQGSGNEYGPEPVSLESLRPLASTETEEAGE